MLEDQPNNFVQIITFLGALGGFLSAAYIIAQKMAKRPKFYFKSYAGGWSVKKVEEREILQISYEGILINRSDQSNSITEVTYTVWDDSSRYKSLSNGLFMGKYTDKSDNVEKDLPIYFKEREAKKLKFFTEVPISGTHNIEIVRARKSIVPGSPMTMAKYEYEIGFRDASMIFFDKDGKIRSQEIMDLWWTLPNTFHALKKGNPFPYLKHMFTILYYWVVFHLKKVKHFFGL